MSNLNRRKFIQISSVVAANMVVFSLNSKASVFDENLTAEDLTLKLLKAGFMSPPDSAKTSCYWWWFNSLVDEEGISLDLAEFKAKGMGGVLLINSISGFGSGPIPEGPKFLSEEWRSLFRHALKEADRHGIEVGVNLSTGWAMGGAWIKPEDSGRWLLQAKTTLNGPARFSGKLPLPGSRDGYDNAKQLFIKDYIDLPMDQLDYRDTSVVAYKEIPGAISLKDGDRAKSFAAKSNRLDASSHAEAAEVMEPTLLPWTASADDQPVSSSEVIDLTSKVKADGQLDWDVPEGSWTVIRTGHRMTGARTAYALPEAAGLEIDWLDKKGVERQFEHLGNILLKEAGEFKGKSLKYFHDDSFEDGFPNWTAGFLNHFKTYRGYDATPYLPVFAGVVVDSAEQSERFLYDYRKTVADCMADGHYKRFAELCHENGLQVQSEAGGPSWSGTMCMDALKNLGRMDLPMGEFWQGKTFVQHDQNQVGKLVASAAHIYGKKKVSAEALTSFKPHWSDSPESLKPVADRAFCEGINRFVIHTSTATRPRDGKPGYEYGAGTHFNRNITWWEKAGVFLDYVNRCQFLLQSGLFVADVLYYNGDWAPNLVAPKRTDPALGKGYDYDVCNEEVLLTRLSVKNKRIVLPDGMSYALMVLPDVNHMPVPVAKKIRELVKGGATIIGPKPVKDPGLKNYPQCDTELKQIVEETWGSTGVITGESVRNVLLGKGIKPDFEYTGEANYIDFIHRTTKDAEIYFLVNRKEIPAKTTCMFRVASGYHPQLWDAVSGRILPLPAYRTTAGRIAIDFDFLPSHSIFVIFVKSGAVALKSADEWLFQGRSGLAAVQELRGSWMVSFDPKWGGPETLKFDSLQDWSKHEDERIKYYSGKAVYRKQFDLSAAIVKGKQLFMDLGVVKNIASIKLNGKDLGTIWTAPWMVDISGAVKASGNQLEIELINLWPNRLIGDAALPVEKRLTNTNIIFKKTDKLLPSGLLGPVTIQAR
ncbi:glycosyl hydrolase [Pedobacter heparinus]|uniref:glycosyl hydrolase n=1 Tax=Pedobacter heparinus TaxID=984 RepID=UPI00292F9336|nr:glycosyl hydrolase [Pedobacter heparinus]